MDDEDFRQYLALNQSTIERLTSVKGTLGDSNAKEQHYAQLRSIAKQAQRIAKYLGAYIAQDLADADSLQDVAQPNLAMDTPSSTPINAVVTRTAHQTASASSVEHRYNLLLEKAIVADREPIPLEELMQSILSPHPSRSNLLVAENDALDRCIRGYADGTAESWDQLLGPYAVQRDTWEEICEASQHMDHVSSASDQLILRETTLRTAPSLSHAERFVEFVLYTVEVLKFVIEWEKHNTGTEQAWKTAYIKQTFKIENDTLMQRVIRTSDPQARFMLEKEVETKTKAFSKSYSKRVAARRTVYNAYLTFGPAIFLDKYWDVTGTATQSRPQGQTKTFRALIKRLMENVPQRYTHDDDGNGLVAYGAVNDTFYASNSRNLFFVLDVLSGGSHVSSHVKSFMEAHPPSYDGVDMQESE